MAYTQHTWQDDEVITKENLNNIENGVKTLDTNHTSLAKEVEKKLYKPADEGSVGKVLGWKAKGETEWKDLPKAESVEKAAGASPTKAEFDALIDALKTAGLMK